MWSQKFCGCGKLSPVSFGLALGITIFFTMMICDLWMMKYGIPPEKAKFMAGPLTFSGSLIHALLGLLQGLIFGIFVALIYDLLLCWSSNRHGCPCCNKSPGSCEVHK